MVNLVEALRPLLCWRMRVAGLAAQNVEIDKGTVVSFWAPSPKAKEGKPKKKKKNNDKIKPAVVLVHGFAADGLITWLFQAGILKKYDVYVPDLLFFGNSVTTSSNRSPAFQAECLVKALSLLGVETFGVVGFSYGGMVAFKMAELYPHKVTVIVVSGSIVAMTDSVSETTLAKLGFASFSDFLLPSSVKGLKTLLSIGAQRRLWFPDWLYRHYLEVMFTNRKERAELLEGLVVNNRDSVIPNFQQKILLLWGEHDQIFNLELAKNMSEHLGDKATLQSIQKAGHLVHLERPCAYNRLLKEFLALNLSQPT